MRVRMLWHARSSGPDNGATLDGGAIIELRRVVKTYPGAAIPALKGIDLQISAGESVAVLGKSGAGKTTLMNMISGLDRPTSGEVLVNGTALQTLSEDDVAAWRGRTIGIVYQAFHLMPSLTVVENVMLPMDVSGPWSASRCLERAMRLLAEVEIARHAHKLPSAVSGGEQQRIAIARALANDPPIILADEPTGSLDSITTRTIVRLFERLVEAGRTVVVATHDPDLARHSNRVIELADGVIVNDTHRSAAAVFRRQSPMIAAEGDK